jgi:hypothetical protein
VERFGQEEMIRHSTWTRELVGRGERIKDYEQRQGRPVKRFTIIEDLGGLSLIPSKSMLSLYGRMR